MYAVEFMFFAKSKICADVYDVCYVWQFCNGKGIGLAVVDVDVVAPQFYTS